MIELPPREDGNQSKDKKRVSLVIYLLLPVLLIILVLAYFVIQQWETNQIANTPQQAKTVFVWTATYLPSDTPIPDPCSQPVSAQDVENIKRLTRRYDELSLLAQSTPKEQLAVVILKMQDIRSDAEAMDVGLCLQPVKEAQLNFMGTVISTMTNFMAGMANDVIQRQIAVSRDLRVQYEIVLAEKQGMKYSTPTPPPTFTPTPTLPTSTPAPVVAVAKEDIYVLQGPSVGYPAIGTFLKDQKANAIGRLANKEWIQIEIAGSPGVYGWVPRQMIKLEGGLLGDLPTAEPPPVN